MRPKIEQNISDKIDTLKKRAIFFVDDFLDFGNSESVKKALLRLQEKQKISRLSHGIYYKPEVSKLLGELSPAIDDVAKAIARRDKARIIPTGVYAQNILGLSTQVPMNYIFLTDGAARKIKIGKRTINFKSTVPKNLAKKGKISTLVIQALKQIKKDNVDEEILKVIYNQLKKEERENIIHDSKLAPAWIREILLKTLDNE